MHGMHSRLGADQKLLITLNRQWNYVAAYSVVSWDILEIF
jgi:hypothetical protein